MIQLLAVAALLGSADHPAPPGDPFVDPNSIVIYATLKSLSRTDKPTAVYAGDQVVVSNSCGYDTAVFRLKEVLLGEYKLPELAAHLRLDEFCHSILQSEVRDYVVHLAWSGDIWNMSNEWSSPLLRARGKSWVVEPSLLAFLESRGLAETQRVRFREAQLSEIAVGRMERIGYVPEPGTTHSEWVAELRSWKPPNDWRDNPMYFAKGLELEAFRRALASNYVLQRMALSGRR